MNARMALFIAAFTVACSSSERVLPFPEHSDALRTGLLFLETSTGDGAMVKEAHAISMDAPGVFRFELEEASALRLLLFPRSLEELVLEPGRQVRPSSGAGREVPTPAAVFHASAETDDEWQTLQPELLGSIPWELPPVPTRNRCEEFRFPSFQLSALTRLQPVSLVALDAGHVVVGGYRTGLDLRVSEESFLASIRNFEDGAPVIQLIGEPWPMDSVSSLVADGPNRVIGVSGLGRIFGIEVGAWTRTESSTRLPTGRNWRLARGRDGTLVVHDGTLSTPTDPNPVTLPGYVLDADTLELTPFEPPEPLSVLEIWDASFMIGAVGGQSYVFDGTTWTREMSIGGGPWFTHFAIEPVSRRAMGIVADTYVLERGSDGTWSALPSISGSFGINQGVFLSTGEYVVGGSAGFYSLWQGSHWCQPTARPFSRDLRALARAPGTDYILTMTYSEDENEVVLLARMEFEPTGD